MECRRLEGAELETWDRLVEESPQGSVYVRRPYLEATGASVEYWGVLDGGELRAGLPVTRTRPGIQTNPLAVKYLGVLHAQSLAEGSVSRRHEVDQLLIEAMPRSPVWMYGFHPAYDNWMPFYWSGFRQSTRYTYRIEFERTQEPAAGYRKNVRAAINKGRKQGWEIRNVALDLFVDILRESFARRGKSLPKPAPVLERMLAAWEDAGLLHRRAVVDADGALLSVAALAYDASGAHLIFNGTREDKRAVEGNATLLDHLIHWSREHCAAFDFEGSMHPGIEFFYRGFGGELTPFSVIRTGAPGSWLYDLALETYRRTSR